MWLITNWKRWFLDVLTGKITTQGRVVWLLDKLNVLFWDKSRSRSKSRSNVCSFIVKCFKILKRIDYFCFIRKKYLAEFSFYSYVCATPDLDTEPTYLLNKKRAWSVSIAYHPLFSNYFAPSCLYLAYYDPLCHFFVNCDVNRVLLFCKVMLFA